MRLRNASPDELVAELRTAINDRFRAVIACGMILLDKRDEESGRECQYVDGLRECCSRLVPAVSWGLGVAGVEDAIREVRRRRDSSPKKAERTAIQTGHISINAASAVESLLQFVLMLRAATERTPTDTGNPGELISVLQHTNWSDVIECHDAAILEIMALGAPIPAQDVPEAESDDGNTGDEITPQYVTLDQMAARANRSKKTLERWLRKDLLPPPDIEGGGGKPHEWIWSNVREALQEHSGKVMPERFPTLRRN